MSQTLSSCPCWNCESHSYTLPKGIPTNFSIADCDDGNAFVCWNRVPFNSSDVQPQFPKPPNKNDYVFINPDSMKTEFVNQFGVYYDPRYFKINCHGNPCDNETYVSHDPRLLDSARNEVLQLDKPPLWKDVPLTQVYNEKLKGYGQHYRTYSDISAGQIIYYNDNTQKDAYFSPNFTIRSDVDKVLFKDPMGNFRPQYPRVPLVDTNDWNHSVNNYTPLTWINDSAYHREDLMSLQMRRENERRWMPRWVE